MTEAKGNQLLRFSVISIIILAIGLVYSGSGRAGSDYYSREQNDGDMARASNRSHYIRFYPGNRVVRLIIPFPYSTGLSPNTIRQVFSKAINKTSGSAYISDTFGILEPQLVAQIDSVRVIEGNYYYDCGVALPCKIEFVDKGMNVVQKGIVKDHITAYQLVPDQPAKK